MRPQFYNNRLIYGHFLYRVAPDVPDSDMLYPFARTSLYAVFLCTLVVLLALAQLVRSGQPWRATGYAMTVVMILVAGLYGLEFRTQWYGDWKFDAGTQDLMRSLIGLHSSSSQNPVHLGVSWPLQTTAEFYREIYHLDWLAPVTRDRPSCEDDYVLAMLVERSVVDELAFEVLKQDPVSGTVLARRGSKSCATK